MLDLLYFIFCFLKPSFMYLISFSLLTTFRVISDLYFYSNVSISFILLFGMCIELFIFIMFLFLEVFIFQIYLNSFGSLVLFSRFCFAILNMQTYLCSVFDNFNIWNLYAHSACVFWNFLCRFIFLWTLWELSEAWVKVLSWVGLKLFFQVGVVLASTRFLGHNQPRTTLS